METSLRWILVIVGVLVIAGILWDGLRRNRPWTSGRLRRREEPGLGEMDNVRLDVEDDDYVDGSEGASEPDPLFDDTPPRPAPRPAAASRETPPPADVSPVGAQARPQPAAKSKPPRVAPRPSDGGPEELLILHVVAPQGERCSGLQVLAALTEAGLECGDMDIFHYYHEGPEVAVPVFSVANMVKPGTLRPDDMDGMTTPGLSLFLRLPGPLDSMAAFEQMLKTARALAAELGGELHDQQRSVLTRQTIEHYRERITELNRKRLAAGRR